MTRGFDVQRATDYRDGGNRERKLALRDERAAAKRGRAHFRR